jgi:HEAT repeat protein
MILCLVLLCSSIWGQPPQTTSNRQAEAAKIVEQMHGISMRLRGTVSSNGQPIPAEVQKHEILRQLARLGKDAMPALILALSDADVQMRQNAAITLDWLASGLWDSRADKVDIRAAIPALTKALADVDANVRGYAANVFVEVGPDAKMAVPALIKLLQDPWEGARLSSCAALRQIGPDAQDALPALRATALNDVSGDVRRCAEAAITFVQKK